jgi:hypothetical protein
MAGPGQISDGRTDPRSLQGIARRRQLRAEDDAEVRRIADGLLMTLRRPATIADELKAETIGRTATKIRRLSEQGRESLAERRLLGDLLSVPFGLTADVTRGPDYRVAEKGDDAVRGRTEHPAE